VQFFLDPLLADLIQFVFQPLKPRHHRIIDFCGL
jgi:hypothetical protein